MKNKASIVVIVLISLAVALLHVVIGPDYHGIFRYFIRGYLIDLLLPMNVYLLLQISLRKSASVWTSRVLGALITFTIGTTTEILQSQGVHIFGSTYDPWDIAMYGAGIGLGLIIDATLIQRLETSSGVWPTRKRTKSPSAHHQHQ